MAPEPEPPLRDLTPAQWVRANLASTPLNALLTVVVGLIAAWAAYQLARWVFVTGDWAVVRVNLKLFMVGFYPADQLWRLWAAGYVVVAAVAFAGGALSVAVRRPIDATAGVAARDGGDDDGGAPGRAVAAVTSVPGPGGVGGSSACCTGSGRRCWAWSRSSGFTRTPLPTIGIVGALVLGGVAAAAGPARPTGCAAGRRWSRSSA